MNRLRSLRSRNRWVIAGILLFGIALLIKFSGNTPIELFTEEEELSQEEPDAFVINGTYTTFSETGSISNRLVADRAEHYPEGDIGALDNPRLNVVDKHGSPWEIQAQSGRLAITDNTLELLGFVTVTGEDQEGKPLRLDSPSLYYDDARRFIHTEQPVTIYSQFNQLSSDGMTFTLDDRILTLHSQVEGIYVTE